MPCYIVVHPNWAVPLVQWPPEVAICNIPGYAQRYSHNKQNSWRRPAMQETSKPTTLAATRTKNKQPQTNHSVSPWPQTNIPYLHCLLYNSHGSCTHPLGITNAMSTTPGAPPHRDNQQPWCTHPACHNKHTRWPPRKHQGTPAAHLDRSPAPRGPNKKGRSSAPRSTKVHSGHNNTT